MRKRLSFLIIILGCYTLQSQGIITDEAIPFELIEKIPITKDCKPRLKTDKLKKCVLKSIQRHVAKKFNTNIPSQLGLNSGLYKVIVNFIIDENGEIKNIVAESDLKELKIEAIRVIKLLPKMTPGMKNENNVKVKFTMPISFLIS